MQQGIKTKHPGRNQHHYPVSVILSGMLILAALFYTLYLWQTQSAAEQARSQFQLDAKRHVDAIHTSLDLHLRVLYTLGGFFNHADQITRAEFHTFARSLLQTSPHIQALEWVPKVTAAERDRFEEQASQAIPGFRFSELNENGDLVTAAPRAEYYPVYFVEPYAGNEVAAGFDLASEKVRRDALNKARDGGQVASSGYIRLVQESGSRTALLSFLPTYQHGADPADIPQRRQHIKGFVLAIFRIGEMLEDAIAHVAIQGIDLWVVDTTAGSQPQLIFTHPGKSVGSAPRSPPSQGLRFEQTIDLPGNQWKAIVAPDLLSAARFQPVEHLAWKLLFVGVLITGLIAWHLNRLWRYASHLTISNRALDDAVTRLRNNEETLRVNEESLHNALVTAELERSRLKDAIESIDSAIAIFDADEQLITSNSKFRDTYYEIKHMIVPGISIKALLEGYFTAAKLDSLTNKSFNISLWVDKWLKNFRQHKTGEIQRVHDRWLLINDYPTSEGGVVSLQYDITSMKEAEKQIHSLNRTHAVLSRSSNSLARAYDEKALLSAFCNNVVEIGGYSIAWIVYAQQDNSCHMELMAIAGDMERESAISLLASLESIPSNPCAGKIATNTGEVTVMRNLQREPNDDAWKQSPILQCYKSMIALPIRVDEKVLGNFIILSSEKRDFNNDEVSLLEELAANLSHGIETMRVRSAREQEMRLFKKKIEMDERKRVAATLHDGVAQTMQAINLRLKSLRTLTGKKQQQTKELLDQIIDNTESAIDELRTISHDLRPILLEQIGFEEAVRHHCDELSQHSNASIHVLNGSQNFKLDEFNKEQCFLGFREAMNNAVRHAEATNIEVVIEEIAPDLLSIQICDNGVGFNTDHKFHLPSGLGLSMISERMQSIGGHAEIDSSPGKGTIVTLITPAKS